MRPSFLLHFCLFAVVWFGQPQILRGYNDAQTQSLTPGVPPPQTPEWRSVETEIAHKTTAQVLTLAHSYSFTDLNKALLYLDVALVRAKKSKNWRDIFDIQRETGFTYEDNGQPSLALVAHEAAAKTAERLHDSLKTTIYNDLAIVNRKLGNYKNAYVYYEKVLEIARKMRQPDAQMIAGAYHGLGELHREAGVYDEAINYYLKSKEISEKLGQTVDIIVSHIALSETYFRAKEIEKALSHIETAYKMAVAQQQKKSNDEEANAQLASTLNRYGEILAAKKDYIGALDKHEAALKVYEGRNMRAHIARTLMNIGSVYLQQKNYTRAEAKFKECLTLETQLLPYDQAELQLKLGTLFFEQNRFVEAEKAYLKCLELSGRFDQTFTELAQKANYQLFLVCLKTHANDRALAYINTAQALSDSLFNAEKIRRTAEMELKFDTEKRKNEIKDLSAKQNRLVLIMSMVIFIVVVVLLGYIIQLRGRSYETMKLKTEEIAQQYRRLEENNELLTQFAYVAAHDLKEPLRSIGSYIGLIQMKYGKNLPDEAKEYMQFVNAGVKRMYSLLTDLLDFSQVITQQPGAEVVRPEEILEDVKDNLRNAIETKNARIECAPNMPSVCMNRLHMMQLFQNLIANALKFSTKTPVVKIEGREEDGQIILTVEDNGIGIKNEYSNKIFVLFQQLNKKDKFEGTGIGLTICKNIVEKYNGKIWFESEENVGTKFFISIPAQVA